MNTRQVTDIPIPVFETLIMEYSIDATKVNNLQREGCVGPCSKVFMKHFHGLGRIRLQMERDNWIDIVLPRRMSSL